MLKVGDRVRHYFDRSYTGITTSLATTEVSMEYSKFIGHPFIEGSQWFYVKWEKAGSPGPHCETNLELILGPNDILKDML